MVSDFTEEGALYLQAVLLPWRKQGHNEPTRYSCIRFWQSTLLVSQDDGDSEVLACHYLNFEFRFILHRALLDFVKRGCDSWRSWDSWHSELESVIRKICIQ